MLQKFLRRSPETDLTSMPATFVDSEDERVWKILHSGPNPTTDYYIKPEIEKLGCIFESELLSGRPQRFRNMNKLIIVRYLTEEWASWINSHRERFSEIVYFMDDELLNPGMWNSLPNKYRDKLAQNYKILRKWLPRFVTAYWVSTDNLRDNNLILSPKVIHPQPLPQDNILCHRKADASRENLIFYHATASHYNEFVWIRPLMGRLLSKHSSIQLELIGDLQINRMFRDLPRTRILHPMSWENYLSYTQSVSGGLGLGPLIATPFNASRSSVKGFDINRMGAKGLYTSNSAYARECNSKRSSYAANTYHAWEHEIDLWLQSKTH